MLRGFEWMSKFKVYDENDNFLGEYIGDFVEDTKENVSDSFDTSLGSGLLAMLCVFAIRFPWLIFVIVGWFILKLIWTVVKFIGRNLWWVLRLGMQCLWWLLQEVVYGIWWLIRVPITLILDRNVPEWWFPDWNFPKW